MFCCLALRGVFAGLIILSTTRATLALVMRGLNLTFLQEWVMRLYLYLIVEHLSLKRFAIYDFYDA